MCDPDRGTRLLAKLRSVGRDSPKIAWRGTPVRTIWRQDKTQVADHHPVPQLRRLASPGATTHHGLEHLVCGSPGERQGRNVVDASYPQDLSFQR